MSDERLKKVGGKLVHRGPIASVRMETFQYADGSRATRQVVVHPGAVCVIPHDGRVLLTSLGCSILSGIAAFWLLYDALGLKLAVAAACAASVVFVTVFGVARRRLRRPVAGTEAFKEAVFLGLLVVAVAIVAVYFAVPS